MAKTIKEMAGDHAENFVLTVDHKGDVEEAYTDGANAVLEEIESCLGEFYSPDDYTNIKNKIKELRGYGK